MYIRSIISNEDIHLFLIIIHEQDKNDWLFPALFTAPLISLNASSKEM